MAWTTPVNISDVRTEYPLLTSDLCADARVTANRDRAEAEVEAVLRDRYELTDPGADKYVWRVCLALTLYHCINSAYGEQGWTSLVRSRPKRRGTLPYWPGRSGYYTRSRRKWAFYGGGGPRRRR